MDKKLHTKLIGPQQFLRNRKNPDDSQTEGTIKNDNQPFSEIDQISKLHDETDRNDLNVNISDTRKETEMKATEMKVTETKSPEDNSIPTYPNLKKDEKIETILRNVAINHPKLNTSWTKLVTEKNEKVDKEEVPRKKIQFRNGFLVSIGLIIDLAICAFVSTMVALVLFRLIYQMFQLLDCSFTQIPNYASGKVECNDSWSDKGIKVMNLIMTAMVGLLTAVDIIPHGKKIIGMNGKGDRISLLAIILHKFDSHENLWITNFRIFCSAAFLGIARHLPEYNDYVYFTSLLMLLYFTIGSSLKMAFDICDISKPTIPRFEVKEQKESRSPFEHGEVDQKKDFLPNLIQTLYILISSVLYIIFAALSPPKNITETNVSFVVIFFILCYTLANTVAIKKKSKFLINKDISIFLSFFATVFLVKLSILAPSIVGFAMAIIHILAFLFTLILRLSELDWKAILMEKNQTVVKDEKQILKINYLLTFGFSLLIITAFTNLIVVQNIFTNESIQHFVYFCRENLTQRDKQLYYNLNITGNEAMLNMLLYGFAFPGILMVVLSFYYIIAERRNSFDHKQLNHYPAIFLLFVILFVICSKILRNLLVNDFSWNGVAESKIALTTLDNLQKDFDLLFLCCINIFAIVLEGQFDDVSDSKDEHIPQSKEVSLNTTNSCCDCKQFAKRALSTGIALLALSFVFFKVYLNEDSGPFMVLMPNDFKSEVPNFDSLDADLCNNDAALKIKELVTNVKTDLTTIKNYNSKIKPIPLLSSFGNKLLFVLPSLLCSIAISAFNLLSIFFQFARDDSPTVIVYVFAASLTALFFGPFLFIAVRYFSFALIFPFYELVMSEAFLRAMQFHGLAFFAPLLAMLEANLEPFATYTPRAASVVSDKELRAAKDEAKDIVVFY